MLICATPASLRCRTTSRSAVPLYLHGTGITALPDNLSVGGHLYLDGTGITALPENLSVGGRVIGFEPPAPSG